LPAYILFILFGLLIKQKFKKANCKQGPAEDIIAKLLESYSGLVDAIATAMPLLGAAIATYCNQRRTNNFLRFFCPFEVKSILILASENCSAPFLKFKDYNSRQ